MRAHKYAVALLTAFAGVGGSAFAGTSPWPAIGADELRITSEPKALGAPAIYLYRQVDRDDRISSEDHYERLKILTDAGLNQGTIRIVLQKGLTVENVAARTIQADGSTVDFDGKIYQSPAGEGRSTVLTATTFTLPAVAVGSILEFRYTIRGRASLIYDSQWRLSADLFTKSARFSLRRYEGMRVRLSWPHGLPPGTQPPREVDQRFVLDAQDIPAFVEEGFAPPADQLRYHVDFKYSSDPSSAPTQELRAEKDLAVYWNEVARTGYARVKNFIGGSRTLSDSRMLKEALGQIIAPGDSLGVQLRKIYDRVQQIPHVPRGASWTDEEMHEDRVHPIKHAADVWRQQRGNYVAIDWLFLALVREAGIPADPVLLPRRDQDFFSPRLRDFGPLVAASIAVTVDGKEIYLDPGTRNLPFGMQPWMQTAEPALRLKPDGGDWVNIPPAKPSDSQIVREGSLQFSSTEALEGMVRVQYTGLEALWRRSRERDDDASGRRKFLEGDFASAVRVKCTVNLLNSPDWDGSETRLVAEFSISIPDWAQVTASRRLVPIGLFGAAQDKMFVASTRVNPLYFWYPYAVHDDIRVQLPVGWHVDKTPVPLDIDSKLFKYQSTAIPGDGRTSLRLTRDFTLDALLLPANRYDAVKELFDTVRTTDEQQVVISTGGPITQ